MSTLTYATTIIDNFHTEPGIAEAELAAAAFLARYSGRTLDADRHDLRTFFQWGADVGLSVLGATRPEIELYRVALEERGLAPSTIDRRLSTVCGYYRFAHIDGRIASNPAQYVRRPKVHPSEGHGMDRGELGAFLFTAERFDAAHAALAVLLGLNGLRVSEACSTNIEDLGFERGHRTRFRPPRQRSGRSCTPPMLSTFRFVSSLSEPRRKVGSLQILPSGCIRACNCATRCRIRRPRRRSRLGWPPQ